MKLPIKKKYFEEIKAGKKAVEFRDAHITFVCEGTGEELRKDIRNVTLMESALLHEDLKNTGFFEDDSVVVFDLK